MAFYGPVVKHFFPMNESPGAQILTDLIAGVRINAGTTLATIDDAAPGLSKRINASAGGVLTENGPWESPNGFDFALITCYQAWADPTNPDYPANAGMASTFLGTQTTDQIKLQPYYSSYCDGECYSSPFYDPMIRQVENQDYIIALVKRTTEAGAVFEHYVDGVYTGAMKVWELPLPIQDQINSITLDSRITLGHGGYGEIVLCEEDGGSPLGGRTVQTSQQCFWPDPGRISRADQLLEQTANFFPVDGNVAATADEGCIYYGIAFLIFENGAPDDFKDALPWLKDDWTTNSDKSMWPAWNSLGGAEVTTFRNATAGNRPDGSEYLGVTQDNDPDGSPGVVWNDRHLRMQDLMDYAGGTAIWAPGLDLDNNIVGSAGTKTPPDSSITHTWNQISSPWLLVPFIVPRGYYPQQFALRQGAAATSANTISWGVYDAETLQLLYSRYDTTVTFGPNTIVTSTNNVFTGEHPSRVYWALAFGEDPAGAKRSFEMVATENTFPVQNLPAAFSMVPGAESSYVGLVGSGPIADWQNPPGVLPAIPALVGNDPLLARMAIKPVV